MNNYKKFIKTIILIGLAGIGLSEIFKALSTGDIYFILAIILAIITYVYDEDLLDIFK